MRFTGALLLWMTFTLIGMKISLLLKKRHSLMLQTLLLFNSLTVEIEYARNDIMIIIENISRENTLNELLFLEDCINEFRNGTDFYNSWKKSVDGFTLYKREEKDKLLQLGSFIGTSDAHNQIKTIKLFIDIFKNYEAKAGEDFQKYGKVASVSGLFFGAALFILML